MITIIMIITVFAVDSQSCLSLIVSLTTSGAEPKRPWSSWLGAKPALWPKAGE